MARISIATLTKLAAERKEITAELDRLTKRKAEIDAKLLSADTSQSYEGNGVVLSFTTVNSLDPAIITTKFPADKFPDYYKLALDTAEFKRHFSAVDLAKYQKVSHRINVRDA